MKNLLIGISLVVLAFCLCSCGKDTPNTSGLEQYVTNSEEVTAIIKSQFGTEDLTYEDVTTESTKATLSQFGNGTFAMQVNGVTVTVNCQNHIATLVYINTGAYIVCHHTTTYDSMLEAEATAATTADPNSDVHTFMAWN